MKFRVKNEFIHMNKRVYHGDIIEVKKGDIGRLKEMNVLGEPVIAKRKTATRKPKEKR